MKKYIIMATMAISLSANTMTDYIEDYISDLDISKKETYRYDYNREYRDSFEYKNVVFGEKYTIYNKNLAVEIDPLIDSIILTKNGSNIRVSQIIDPTQIKKDSPRFIQGNKIGDLKDRLSYAIPDKELEKGCKNYASLLNNGKTVEISTKIATRDFGVYLGNVVISKASCRNQVFNR